MNLTFRIRWKHLAALIVACGLSPAITFAHCDSLDGPVVKAAQQALASSNVNLALIWVQKPHEGEVRHAFAQTLAVRALNSEAKALADHYFFETLVRVHRAGEGAPYTGLKPAGRDLGPAIPAGDKAIETGNAAPVLSLLTEETQRGLHKRFSAVRAKKNFAPDNVPAGREFVHAYVDYIHYLEAVHAAATAATQPGADHSVTPTKGHPGHQPHLEEHR